MHLCSTVIFQNGRYQKLSSCRTVRNFISILFVLFLFFAFKKKLIFFILFTFFFSFVVFKDSGFKRTLCGSKWETLKDQWSKSDNLGSSKARYGCCPANKYMSSPIGFDRCENGNYNTQLACQTPGYWVDRNGDGYKRCGYCPQGTWMGLRTGCNSEYGNDLITIINGTSCLYDFIFYSQSYL